MKRITKIKREEWHPKYIAFLKKLKGKTLEDFDIRKELHPAGFPRKFYRAYLGKKLIVGAESVKEVKKMVIKLLERADSLENPLAQKRRDK